MKLKQTWQVDKCAISRYMCAMKKNNSGRVTTKKTVCCGHDLVVQTCMRSSQARYTPAERSKILSPRGSGPTPEWNELVAVQPSITGRQRQGWAFSHKCELEGKVWRVKVSQKVGKRSDVQLEADLPV